MKYFYITLMILILIGFLYMPVPQSNDYEYSSPKSSSPKGWIASITYERIDGKDSFRFKVKNTSNKEKHLTFPTSQQFKYEIINEQGETIGKDGMIYSQVVTEKSISQGESLDYKFSLEGLEEGRYTVNCYSLATQLEGLTASLEFEIPFNEVQASSN